jgi:hypothetical protein
VAPQGLRRDGMLKLYPAGLANPRSATYITSVAVSPSHITAAIMRSIVTTAPDGTRTETTEIFNEEIAIQRIRQDSLETTEADGRKRRPNCAHVYYAPGVYAVDRVSDSYLRSK